MSAVLVARQVSAFQKSLAGLTKWSSLAEETSIVVLRSHFKEIPEITGDWQVAVRHREVKEILEFRVEPKEESQPTDPIAVKVKSAIEVRYPDMWRNYVKGMFDIDFAYATRNTLRQKRKLRRIVDERE